MQGNPSKYARLQEVVSALTGWARQFPPSGSLPIGYIVCARINVRSDCQQTYSTSAVHTECRAQCIDYYPGLGLVLQQIQIEVYCN